MLQNTNGPIRIRFERTRYPHWGSRSGYVRFVDHLDKTRFQTMTHAASDSDDDLPRWLGGAKPALRRFIARGGNAWYKLSDLNAELAAFADCVKGRLDIVHFLDGEHSGQYLPRLLRLTGQKRVRTIATFHQPPDVLQDLLEHKLLARLDQIVLVSPSQLDYFRRHVAYERLHVILHGIDTEHFRPKAKAAPFGSLRCVTAGHWLRDWTAFRAVAERLPAVSFDVVTDRDIGIEGLPNVRQQSNLSDLELLDLYQTADILFLPLVDATANNTLLEGMACGLPVVTSDIAAVRAYLPGEEGILVPNNEVEGFVQAIRQLQENTALRSRLARGARLRAESLSWSFVANQYEALYEFARAQPPLKLSLGTAATA